MAYLTVGVGQQYATVSAAVAASHDGDTLYVQAGTYTNDFSTVNTKISIIGVGGMAHFIATVPIPNGKAFFVTNNDVTFDHVEFSGAAVGSNNGAGIRQQAGNLTVTNSYFHNNQEGILGNPIAGATVTIDHSEFGFNGAGDGHSHNIYIGQIASLTVTNSYFHDASVGHELKSRAAINILTNNRFVDANSTASYSIDLSNGGATTIQNNFIQQGPNSQNPTIIAYAEEVATPYPGSSLLISGNTIFNQHSGPLAVWNHSSLTAMINGNHFYGVTPAQIVTGPSSLTGNDTLPAAPAIDNSHPWLASPWDDLISGGAGADVLNGTSGHDLFVGGGGNDTFVIVAGGSSDTIADFAAGLGAGDVVSLQGFNFANFAAVQSAMSQVGADTVLNLGNGETLTFKGVLASLFAADDFLMGGAPPPDTTPPTLATTSPADNSTNVAVGANLVLTFSENVMAGAGNVVIHNAADGSVVATIAITDASQVSFAGSTLTINPTSNLAPGTHYYVTMASGAVQDLAGNAYAGLSAATDFDFTTASAPVDTTPPTLSATNPADNSTNVAVGANLVLTFSESVKAGLGNLIIHNAADGSTVASIAITDASQVSFAGSTLTINPTSDLAPGTHYYVTMASGVVQDLAGNAYAGLSAATDLDFTTASPAPANKVAYDFNGDSRSDILWQNDSGQAAVWLMNGTNVVATGNVGTPDPTWHVMSAGDFDGDGKADLLLQNDNGQAAIWLMNGTNVLSSTNVGANLGPTWHVKSAADFNGDGKADILWQNDSGQAAVWLMNGTSVLSSANIGSNLGTSWHVEAAGDFNGDGKADIIWQNDNGQAAMWLMNGTAVAVADTIGPNMGASWHIEGTGDFNGDGKSDILWQNDSGQAAIWLMSGRQILSNNTKVGSNPGPTWHVEGAQDFNGDGKADILWQDDSGQAMVWLMNGTTVLTTSAVGANPGSPWHVAPNDDTIATGLAHISNAAMDLGSPVPAANPFDHLDHLGHFGGDLIV